MENKINQIELEYKEDLYKCEKEKLEYTLQFYKLGIDINKPPKNYYMNPIKNQIETTSSSCISYASVIKKKKIQSL